MNNRWIGLAVLSASVAMAQGNSAWTVKPDWVRAHEEFLASDAMQGRGSATRDEEITAQYVASQFIGYGLKTAPGISGYLQTAEVVAPQLDGHAILTVAGQAFFEGRDFDLLTSPGTSAEGTLLRVAPPEVKSAKVPPHSAVLIGGEEPQGPAFADAGPLLARHAALVMIADSPAKENLQARLNARTRTPSRLADAPPAPAMGTVILLHADAAARLTAADGADVHVAVTVLPDSKPRQTFNAIGYLEGSDPAAGTILLTAHMDHLGVGRPVNGDAVYNGANDDASGTIAVLELAHALAAGPKLPRSVLFVCYGSEELGLLGSTYFALHAPVPLNNLVANLEFEMIGNQDPKMPNGVLLLTGWDRSNLGPELNKHGALLGPDPYPEQHFFERSDNYALALKGVVAHTAAGWGTPPTYHRPSDDLAHLNLPLMTAAIQSLVEPVRWLANSNFKPEWAPGRQPKR